MGSDAFVLFNIVQLTFEIQAFSLLEKVLSDMVFKIAVPLLNICGASGNGDLILTWSNNREGILTFSIGVLGL